MKELSNKSFILIYKTKEKKHGYIFFKETFGLKQTYIYIKQGNWKCGTLFALRILFFNRKIQDHLGLVYMYLRV